VYTAPETQQILAQNELVEGRIVQRTYQADMQQQTTRLRTGASAQRRAEQAALVQSNREVVQEVRLVRKAIAEQEYYRANEHDDLFRARKKEETEQRRLEKRYQPNRRPK
jgi:hypothetical protein